MSMNHLETATIDAQLKEIDRLYAKVTYWQRLKKMVEGMKAKPDTKEYKEAIIELQRLSAPVVAVLLPCFCVALLILTSASKAPPDRVFETQIIEVEELNQLEEIKPLERPPEQTTDVTVDVQVDAPSFSDVAPTENVPMSPQPQTFDAVQIVKSPVILKNIYGSTRNTGTRGSLLGRFGGDKVTEECVMRALRWLKKNQQPNGSWRNQSIAMTGLAILTFLAHGEKPGDSPEFGTTVQKALEFLISQATPNGRFKGPDQHEYALPIATYAICEAYGMTMNPNVKEVAEKALATIIAGQHPSGGWDYNVKQTTRDDTSYMGWCAQALKAGQMANLDVEGLSKASKLSVRGFKKNAGPSGGFGYISPSGNHGLTAVGTLCMQLHGASAEKEVRMSLEVMDQWSPSFERKQGPIAGESLQYYFYYATQCKFHAGGRRWDTWNAMMKKVYVPAQKITPKETSGYVDHKGQQQAIGWWENKDAHSDRPVMDTCLAALQLMVYYRYLPTTSAAAIKVEEEIKVSTTDNEDIKVDAGDL
jgi:hypothetical protein